MGLGTLNGNGEEAAFGEGKLFAGFVLAVILMGMAIYLIASSGETRYAAVLPPATAPTTSSTVASTSSTVTTTSSTATTLPAATTLSQDSAPKPSTSTTTLYVTSSTTGSTTSSTVRTYLSKYVGKGFRQAYLEVVFICPSCVPAVSKNLENEPGVIAKSLAYRQKVGWVIYDPKEARMERILQLTSANGESKLINDTEIR